MVKRALFSILLLVTVFSCMSWAQNLSRYRMKFTVSTPFLLEKDSLLAIPAGEYWVKDMGTSPGHLLSLQRAKDLKHVAFLSTARIDRARMNWRDETRAVFDFEETKCLPVLRHLYIPGTDGYEILSANLVKDKAMFVEAASLCKTSYTITERTIEEERVVETPPAPVVEEPAPVEQPPQVEQPKEEIKPEPVPPVPQRPRVRKD